MLKQIAFERYLDIGIGIVWKKYLVIYIIIYISRNICL